MYLLIVMRNHFNKIFKIFVYVSTTMAGSGDGKLRNYQSYFEDVSKFLEISSSMGRVFNSENRSRLRQLALEADADRKVAAASLRAMRQKLNEMRMLEEAKKQNGFESSRTLSRKELGRTTAESLIKQISQQLENSEPAEDSSSDPMQDFIGVMQQQFAAFFEDMRIAPRDEAENTGGDSDEERDHAEARVWRH